MLTALLLYFFVGVFVGEGLAPPELLGTCHEIGGRQAPALRIVYRFSVGDGVREPPNLILRFGEPRVLDVPLINAPRCISSMQSIAYHHGLPCISPHECVHIINRRLHIPPALSGACRTKRVVEDVANGSSRTSQTGRRGRRPLRVKSTRSVVWHPRKRYGIKHRLVWNRHRRMETTAGCIFSLCDFANRNI